MNIKNKISTFRKFILKRVLYYNEEIKKDKLRKKKGILVFKDILYFVLLICGNNISYDIANSIIKTKTNLFVSKEAFSNRLKNIDQHIFKNLLSDISKYIENDISPNNDIQIYGVDGSSLSLSKNLSKDGFKLTRNKKYCRGMLSILYDVNNKFPIMSCVHSYYDERKAFVDNLIEYAKPKSIVVFDAGYYSNNIARKLSDHKLKYIIRLKI